VRETIELRAVIDSDLPILFEHQADPIADEMAALRARDRDSFVAHWAKILMDESNIIKTILYNGQIAGTVMSFNMEGKREVGYWIGREYWGKGIATQALGEFLGCVNTRPIYGVVAKHNIGSRRVLEKCGFTMVGEQGNDLVLMLK
jgi:RimJ/RimL family protein N-acetyltransferase